ncbi:MAG TPA: type VI secretion system baseplate subunit TssG [Candidatus Binataceae bacterium]|nr:type VI secretion system baseplate subunit TssG [Candidatus Binataceae bacterium]
MAAASGKPNPSLEDILFEEGFKFDFFQAVRLLETIDRDRERVGGAAGPREEAVRFRSHVALAFPPSAIDAIERGDDDGPPARMTVAFMGLAGVVGVLPWHYTETIIERMRRRDFALADFLDLFNHRLIALFYRAWEKYRFSIGFERNWRDGRGDPFSLMLFDFIGMGTAGLRGRLAFGDEALLFYAGLLGQRPRSASALANILSDFFGVGVKVEQFVGQWLDITEENLTRLGEANSVLGESAVAGTRIWDQQAKFALRVGPLDAREFDSLLPTGERHRAFIQMARYCSGQEFDFNVRLALKASEVPWCRLGDRDARLGYSTWLKTREFERDADDVVFTGALTRLGALPG